MNLAVAPSSHWQISTRPTGEVLTARTCADDVDLVVLGIPAGFTVAEVEGWMLDLLGVARETSRNDSGERPIPGLLHHILTGLLFSHAELWDRAGGTLACSCVFLRTATEVAFGWVGDRDPEVWIRGQRLDVEWVRVRDDEGREARAFAIDAQHPLEIRLVWPNELEMEAEGRSVELSARWPARVEAPVDPPAVSAPVSPIAPSAPSAPAPVFSMPMIPGAARPAAESLTGTPLDIEPRSSIEPTVAGEVQSPSWPPAEVEAPLPEALPQDSPGLTFTPPALEPVAPAVPAAARIVEVTPEPAVAPAPPVSAAQDDSAWDLESGGGGAPVESAPPAWNAEPVASHVEESPVEEPRGQNWSVVYEPEAGVLGPESTAPPQKKGVLGWISGLMKRKPAPTAEPMLTYEPSLAPREDAPPVMHAPELQERVAPTAPVQIPRLAPEPVAGVEAPQKLVAPVEPDESTRITQLPVTAPPPIERVTVVAQFPPVATTPVAPPAPPASEPAVVAPRAVTHPPVARAPVAPPPTRGPGMFTTSAPVELEPIGAPAAATPPRTPTTVARAVAANETTREEADVPWLGEEPVEATPRAARASRPPAVYTARTAREYGPAPLWKRPWVWGVALVALFGGGWLVGAMQDDGHKTGPGLSQRVLKAVGLGGARYQVVVNSRPPGAWIAVDGKDMARRTPATIDLPPGEHPVTLSFADLGAATFNVRGVRGDKVALDAALWGSLAVRGSDMSIPIAVSVDGKSMGFAPVMLDSMAPGAHEVRFSGPGMPSWSQTVTVRVGEATDVLARPMTSPATGVIDVRASAAGAAGDDGITGAAVYIDGVRRGSTPFTIELPRGPHSIRVENQGEVAPVQVIDLPGGNQRFATFEFGLDIERPTMTALAPPARIPMDRPAVISASLLGVGATEVREMWLHVRTPDETWRRYQMVMMKATGGVVGVAVFPPTMFDSEGRARWYVSASTQTGDDYFTEIQSSELQAPAARR